MVAMYVGVESWYYVLRFVDLITNHNKLLEVPPNLKVIIKSLCSKDEQ